MVRIQPQGKWVFHQVQRGYSATALLCRRPRGRRLPGWLQSVLHRFQYIFSRQSHERHSAHRRNCWICLSLQSRFQYIFSRQSHEQHSTRRRNCWISLLLQSLRVKRHFRCCHLDLLYFSEDLPHPWPLT